MMFGDFILHIEFLKRKGRGFLRKISLALFLISLILLTPSLRAQEYPSDTPHGQVHEIKVEDVIGDFDEDEFLSNDTEDAYRLPDIGVFTGYFPSTDSLTTGIVVELHDRKHRQGLLNWFKVDALLSEQRLGISIGRKLIPVVDITMGIVISRDFQRDEYSLGFALSMIKF